MSSRALRRLREEKEAEAAALAAENEDEDEISSEEEEDRGGGGFMQMLEEEDSESESESSSDDEEDVKRPIIRPTPKVEEEKVEEDLDDILNDMNISQIANHHAELLNPKTEEPQTMRAMLLSKSKGFNAQDMDLDYAMRSLLGGGVAAAAFAGVDDPFAMEGEQQQQRNRGRNSRGQRGNKRTVTKKFIFGKPKAEWGKPPSYVGGGFRIMELTTEVLEEERDSWSIPWPYNLKSDDGNDDGKEEASQKWYSFQMSDTYQEQNKLYEELLGNQGAGADPNSLAMFVADNPYFAETLLQLAMVLYYVNDRGKGSDLLRRCIYVYESALPSNVLPTVTSGKKDDKEVNENEGEILIDIDRSNSGLFATLFRVMQTSGMSGLHNSALATGRYLLSLDPLRDPMGVLLILDYYALASRRTNPLISDGGEEGASFIVDLVDSDFIKIHHKDPLTDRHHQCSLKDMPNWAYSYALALYRLSMNEDDNAEEYQDRAEEALVYALRTFPMVLPKLLAMNNVNVEDRSMIMDWQTILPLYNSDANSTANSSTTIDDRVSRASGEHLVRIFVQRCHKLWKEEDVVKWLYACAHRVVEEQVEMEKKKPSSKGEEQEDEDLQAAIALSLQQDETAEPKTVATNKSYKEGQQVLYTNSQGSSKAIIKKIHLDDKMQPYYTIAVDGREKQTDDAHLSIVEEAEKDASLTSRFSIALARYAQCDPSEYEDAFHTFNPEAIALNPNLVAPAMALDPNGRRRFIRRGQQQQQLEEQMGAQDPMDIIRRLLGQAANDGGVPEQPLDPDSPLLQLYLQSLLPWNQVEGVPPPRQG